MVFSYSVFTRGSLFRNIVLFVLLCLLFLPLPANNLWWREFFNSGHTALFALLSFVIYRQIKSTAYFSNTVAVYPFVLFVGLLLGALAELLQNFVQREASLNDLYGDFFGLSAGLCLIAAYELKASRDRKTSVISLVAISGSLLLIGISPLIQLSWLYVERKNAFPVVMDFDANWASCFARFNNVDLLARTSLSRHKSVYPVQFNRGKYPGISVIEPEPDWSAYHSLRVNIFSGNKADVVLTLRVHDATHNQQFSDRYNKKLLIRSGMNEINIPLSRVAITPSGRDLDLQNVAGIILFMTKLEESVWLEVGNIYLE